MEDFVIVDPNLIDFVGHHFEYDYSTAVAAQKIGFNACVLGHRSVIPAISESVRVIPSFTRTMWDSDPVPASTDETYLAINKLFLLELKSALSDIGLTKNAVIFGHMITERQLLGWAWLIRDFAKIGNFKFILLLRYQSYYYDNDICKQAFELLEGLSAYASIKIVSDSERLAQEIGWLTLLPVDVVPIPHTSHQSDSIVNQSNIAEPAPLKLVSLGNARDEKGILEIFDAILEIDQRGRSSDFQFILQVNDASPDVKIAIDDFSKHKLQNVTLIYDALSTSEYYEILRKSDVVMLPYWISTYSARTSGVCIEAITHGKPVICTDGTWLSDQFKEFKSAILCEERNSASLTLAIFKVKNCFNSLKLEASRARDYFEQFHNAENLVRYIIGSQSFKSKSANKKRIAVLFPWDDLLKGQIGASRRTTLMIDFFCDLGFEVRALQSGEQSGKRASGAIVEGLPEALHSSSKKVRFLEWIKHTFKFKRDGMEHFTRHIGSRHNRKLECHINEMVRWADVVVLEYTFWAFITSKACKKYGRKLLITDHDIVSEQVRWPLLRRRTFEMEVEALRLADHAIMVSELDHIKVKSLGIQSTLITNPADLQDYDIPWPNGYGDILQSLYDLNFGDSFICLFIGSAFWPNYDAFKSIKKMSADIDIKYRRSDIVFVVAGGCAPAGQYGRVKALGRVDSVLLRALYERAQLVLVPLMHGTGTSIKTIEAMAAGKLVLGSNKGFRGFNVTSGVNCIIENDLQKYPELIVKLANDKALCEKVGCAARSFSKEFDYRHLFKGYMSIIDEKYRDKSICDQAVNDIKITPNVELRNQILERAAVRLKWNIVNDMCTEILKSTPDDPFANYFKSKVLALQDPPDTRAFEFLDRAAANSFNPYRASLDRQILLRKIGQTEASDRELNLLRNLAIRQVSVGASREKQRAIVHSLFFAGARDISADVAKRCIESTPESIDAEMHYFYALSLQETGGDHNIILKHYQIALDNWYDEVWIRFHRARQLIALGQIIRAWPDVLRVCKLAPQQPILTELLDKFGNGLEMLFSSPNRKLIIKYFNELSFICPERLNGNIYYLVALVLKDQGKRSDAMVQQFSLALDRGSNVFWTLYHRAIVLYDLKRFDEARIDIEKAISLVPESDASNDLRSRLAVMPTLLN